MNSVASASICLTPTSDATSDESNPEPEAAADSNLGWQAVQKIIGGRQVDRFLFGDARGWFERHTEDEGLRLVAWGKTQDKPVGAIFQAINRGYAKDRIA